MSALAGRNDMLGTRKQLEGLVDPPAQVFAAASLTVMLAGFVSLGKIATVSGEGMAKAGRTHNVMIRDWTEGTFIVVIVVIGRVQRVSWVLYRPFIFIIKYSFCPISV
jgi:hypothetical protein